MSRGGVAMQDAFLDGLIDFRNGLGQQRPDLSGLAGFQSAPEFLDGSAQFGAIITINAATSLVLAHSLFS
jgi:hypothetical protein